jgi:predicted unusual protein kinase regulating ubiquinone biosynthesis (AarF/ABC1/UbiB family)
MPLRVSLCCHDLMLFVLFVLFAEQPTQVKVQFPAIARQLKIDLAAIKVCVAFIGRVFPKFEYTWVLPEFEGCVPSL